MNAERSIIGCILLGSHESEMFTSIAEDDFTDRDCRRLFVALRNHWQEYEQVDIGCVPAEYTALAAECAEFLPSLSSWKSYIAAAKNNAMKHRAQGLALSIATGDMDISEIRESANNLVLATQGNERVRRMTMAQAIKAFYEDQRKEPNYISTGINTLDKTAYIENGDYVVIAARPSTGKTALALKLARHMAGNGVNIGFYTYETKIEKMMGRTVAAHCNIPINEIKNHKALGYEEIEHLNEDLSDLPFEFIESSGKDINWLKADIIRNKFDAVFIDYIGLIPSSGNDRTEKVTNSSLGIRDICQSSGTTAFVLCQINRQGKAAPTMEDLKESGQIEQDADAILILHNPRDIKEREKISDIDLIIAKNKEGSTGCIDMKFDGSLQEFWEVEDRYGR